MKLINKIEISNYIYILIMILVFLLSYNMKAQSFLSQEIAIVEFNSNWNESNHLDGLDKLKNCKTYNVSICDNPNYMDEFNIKLPSIIIYNNGNEVKRYKTNILFTFEINYKNLQSDVDSLLLTKFN